MNTLQNFSVAVSTAIFALGVSAGSASSANLVVNGGFETGNFSGWTQNFNTSQTSIVSSNPAPYEGIYSASFGPDTPGTITQFLNTNAGESYTLSYALINRGRGNFFGLPLDFFGIFVNGNLVDGFLGEDPFPWTVFSYNFTATSPSTRLSFAFSDVPSFIGLDAVSVTSTRAVPVPSAVFGVVVAGGALMARHRKNAKAKQTVA